MANTTLLSDADILTQVIHENIPLSEAMQFKIETLAERSIIVAAPLSANINIHGTGFAGSLYSLSALAAWSLTTHLVNQAALKADVVMAKAEIRYRRPVQSDIRCHCQCLPEVAKSFIQHLSDNGRGRLSLMVEVGESADVVFSASMIASQKV